MNLQEEIKELAKQATLDGVKLGRKAGIQLFSVGFTAILDENEKLGKTEYSKDELLKLITVIQEIELNNTKNIFE